MQLFYLHETMEQNHKHFRRRRTRGPHGSDHIFGQALLPDTKTATTTKVTTCLSMRPREKKVLISLPLSHHTLAQLFLLPSLILSLLLFFVTITSPYSSLCQAQSIQQNFLLPGHNMENVRISELQPLDSIVYQLRAVDRTNENRKFSYHMTGDTFSVDEFTGDVRLIKPLDRERQAQIVVVVSVFDISDSKSDLPVESKRRTVIVEDVDDSWPVFSQHKQSILTAASQQHQVYQVEVSEQAPVGSIVLAEVMVTDADEGPNAELVFECRAKQSTNSACDTFSIESRRLSSGRYSLSIRSKALLDYEQVQAYKMALVARSRRPSPLKGVPLETEAMININLVNVQDEGPVFVNAPYSLSMHEGLKSGTRLLNLIVQDGDASPQRDLSVIVVPGKYSEYFQISGPELDRTNIWYLETNVTIDRENPLITEAGNSFTISLMAVELDENGQPVASERELSQGLLEPNYSRGTLRRENVTIVVLDLPDTSPMFVRASTGVPIKDNVLVVNISESIASGAPVPNLDLAAYDLDQGINSRFNLSLMDADIGPPASQAFGLELEVVYGKAEIVLNVLNSSLLDYERPELRSYRFNLVASKHNVASRPLAQILDVQVNIVDANDNSPEFEREQYILEVIEGAPPGALVASIKARDYDSGVFGKVNYMLRGQGASKFKVISNDGKIIVDDCGIDQCIDYETQPSYSLTYEARDGGGRMKNVSVIINVVDINDHAPKFTESVYKRELISDNLSSNQNYISPQLIVRAKDGDGPSQGRNNITYRIKNTNLTSLDVDPISGLVYFSQPLDLDNMVASMNAPASGLPAASGGRSLSMDFRITFEAEVVAEDNGSPMLNSTAKIQLTVKGNRDGAPQFKMDQYQATVRENQPINKPFFQVQAIDPDDKDSQLRYSLGYDLNDLININPLTGELSFKTKVDYDDFKGVPYNISVQATDNSRPYPLRTTALISISIMDVNDKAPKFEEKEYTATLVQGRTKLGDTVLQVRALDSDKNALLNYSIITDQLFVHDRNGQQFGLDDVANSSVGYLAQMSKQDRTELVNSLRKLFEINKRTGAIEIRSEPDYSFAASVTILVRVQDLNQEIFLPTGEIQEDSVACTFFLQAHIDRTPIFAPPWTINKREYNFSILEELVVGTTIFSLLAKDPVTNNRIEIYEKLFDSDPQNYFRINRTTGVVQINRRIDYEELPAASNKRLSVSVKALTEDALYSIANLNIQVIDLNDNAPQFRSQNYSVAVSESVTYPKEIFTVSADDRDSNEFNQVYYSLSGYSSEHFVIDSRKGVIMVKKGVRLDRDTEPNHSLFVTASDCNETVKSNTLNADSSSHHLHHATVQDLTGKSDGSTSSSAPLSPACKRSSVVVSVSLLDENDNDPIFINVNKRGEFEALAAETASVGTVITQVSAMDVDDGANGHVGYEVIRSDEPVSRAIKIDQEGSVSITESLSGLGRATPYRITLRAFDHGKPARQTYVSLLLTISDVVSNDGVPRFVRPRPNEVVQVSESAGPSTFVYQVQAVDPDEEANGKLMYKFVQPSEIFEIDPFTGVIKTKYRPNFYLDRELVPNYTLIVIAHDLGSPPKEAHQVLYISITDVNDNEPYFERGFDDPPLVLQVEEEAPPGQLVGTIQAVDKDIGQNALIGYDIIEGNQNNLFRLDYDSIPAEGAGLEGSSGKNSVSNPEPAGNNPCRIYSTGRLDREARESYTLTIKASAISKLRNSFIQQLRDPLGSRNPFNQYNASDLTKIKVTIKLMDINDNRPVFGQKNAKSVVDSSAEVYSQLMVFKAEDADSSNAEIQYSILDALYYSDSKYRLGAIDTQALSNLNGYMYGSASANQAADSQPISMRHAFDIDSSSGILRNSISLRPYTDGYFELFVKADSGQHNQQSGKEGDEFTLATGGPRQSTRTNGRCADNSNVPDRSSQINNTSNSLSQQQQSPFAEMENCFVAVTRATVFVTHQRETFRFVFNKTKLNDRLDEFRGKIQNALEELLFEPASVQASLGSSSGEPGLRARDQTLQQTPARSERVYLNTFNTDFYEREDGSLDFSTLTSCSQLVKFDDRAAQAAAAGDDLMIRSGVGTGGTIVPNQVINYEEVLTLLKTLNATQARQQKGPSSLFNQYGLVSIERCLPDRTLYRMSLSEKVAIYFGIAIALIGALLAFIVSSMRKSYEKNLKLLQRSKYQYMSPYGTLAPGVQAPGVRPPAHHMSLGTLQSNNFIAPSYGSHLDYDGPVYDTWQL